MQPILRTSASEEGRTQLLQISSPSVRACLDGGRARSRRARVVCCASQKCDSCMADRLEIAVPTPPRG
eukprot:6197427-Pleurochrysis_carterae.AAC.4